MKVCLTSRRDDVSCHAEVDVLEAAVRAEQAELRDFFERHRCPSEDAILDRLEKEGMSLAASTSGKIFDLDGFDYASFKLLWEAPVMQPVEVRRLRRQVGEALHRAGGFSLMQMHYYLLHFALCSGAFINRAQLPIVVFASGSDLERAWDGIGAWQA